MRNKIALETITDVNEFLKITSSIDGAQITVTDDKGMRVNARSLMGMLYALEFDELWCESDVDIYSKIEKFVID